MRSTIPNVSFTVRAPDGTVCHTHAYTDVAIPYATVECLKTDTCPPQIVFYPDEQVTKVKQTDPYAACDHAAALCALYMALSFQQNSQRLDGGNLDEGVML
jgi:hypothetical protein